jgi:hypothetical protein
VLCKLAGIDNHRFRELMPDSDQTTMLRTLTRSREVLVQQRFALCYKLRAELERTWPGASPILAELDSPISPAFVACFTSLVDARGFGAESFAQFLARDC